MSSSRSVVTTITASILASIVVLGAGTGCRLDAQQCDKACRNAMSLAFWKAADQEIAAAPADQRAALRKQKLNKFTQDVESGLEGCVLRCQSSRNQDAVDCLTAARTAEQAQACTR